MQYYQRPDLHCISPQDLELHGKLLTDLVREVLAQGRQIRLSARGSSMTPFINDGDLITIAPLSDCTPRLGEIFAFHHMESSELVVHRMVRCVNDNYILKGDNEMNNSGDQVPRSAFFGRIVGIERSCRKIRFGLGPEKAVVAWLSRKGWLIPLRVGLAKLRRHN